MAVSLIVLGGRGGTSSLRLDPQGKSYAAMLLDLPEPVPEAMATRDADLDWPACLAGSWRPSRPCC